MTASALLVPGSAPAHGVPRPFMLPDTGETCFTFADFTLYPRQRTLLHGQQIVPIGGRAFDLLLHLVVHPGIVISLTELMQVVWPSVTVEEANLRVQMGLLRKFLGRSAQAQRAIETIPLRGYCFILPVQQHHPAAPDHGGIGGLPVLLNPVIGRDHAIDLLARTLDTRRLVTITGPAGIGKTTLAIATAQRHAGRFAAMVRFVDLSSADNGAQAAGLIAQALGLAEEEEAETETELAGALCEHLRVMDLLLVLDTCEHIVEAMADLVETLLAHAPGLRVLATSREALRANAEWTQRLGPLPFPQPGPGEVAMADYAAVALFMDRCGAAMQPGALVGEICRRLDGIPLALELAAARMADLGLHGILARLDDCLAILTRGHRTALPRHRTLAAALDWSYRLLSREERATLRYLAAFPGRFSAQEAAVLFARLGHAAPPEALSDLYEKSLLSVDPDGEAPMYRLLGTLRTYVTSHHALEQG